MGRVALSAALAGAVATLVGAFLPAPWLPLLAGGAVYPLFVKEIMAVRLGRASMLALVWAIACTVTMWGLVAARGTDAIGPHVLRGPSYAEEMLTWIRTGIGAESSPSLFLPVHARHFAAFVVGSIVSGGFVGLCFGALLLNYMNFYVASFAAAAAAPIGAYAMGWPIWAVVRVVGFVLAGAALTHLFYAKLLRRGRFSSAAFRRYFGASLALVVLDVVLKTLLAEPWRKLLTRVLS